MCGDILVEGGSNCSGVSLVACLARVRECFPDVGISLLVSKLEEAGVVVDEQGVVCRVDLIPAEDNQQTRRESVGGCTVECAIIA